MNKKVVAPDTSANHIAIFQEKTIRRTWHNAEWWFAIVDVVAVLTDSVQPEGYVKDLRRRDKELAKGWGQIATPLRIETEGGAQQVNCANTEGLFRIIQSIPSPRAEPFKRWLAQVGYERVKQIENPANGTYWRKLKKWLGVERDKVVTICHGLRLEVTDQDRA